jgi:hypothetical protein
VFAFVTIHILSADFARSASGTATSPVNYFFKSESMPQVHRPSFLNTHPTSLAMSLVCQAIASIRAWNNFLSELQALRHPKIL